MSEVFTTAHCPEYQRETRMNVDTFEDVYRCEECEMFYYPAEVGKPENPDAGILHLGEVRC